MKRPDLEGRPPCGSRPQTQPAPASRDESLAPVRDTAQLDLEAYRAELTTTARDTGTSSAERNDAEWSERVAEWIYDRPPGFRFTADTIRTVHGSSRATGSVIRTCAHRRVIRRVGYTGSTSATRHAGTIAIWERT